VIYILRFFPSSKCSLFHNYNVFGSCIIHILYTGCAKIKEKTIPAPKAKKVKMGVECGMFGRDEKMHGFQLKVKT
jgi:hypothetical protein